MMGTVVGMLLVFIVVVLACSICFFIFAMRLVKNKERLSNRPILKKAIYILLFVLSALTMILVCVVIYIIGTWIGAAIDMGS